MTDATDQSERVEQTRRAVFDAIQAHVAAVTDSGHAVDYVLVASVLDLETDRTHYLVQARENQPTHSTSGLVGILSTLGVEALRYGNTVAIGVDGTDDDGEDDEP